MNTRISYTITITAFTLLATSFVLGQENDPAPPMTFFVTSVNPGDGGNLGGLEGADKHCQTLAAAVGAGNQSWRAYLSTDAVAGQPAINARDRIGKGPWHNANGALIAANQGHLHGDTIELARVSNTINWRTALNEKGETVNRVRGEPPLQHDILTGSQPDGRAYVGRGDHTCENWTNNDEGSAQLGHHDRTGGSNISWNSAHPSRGCSPEKLQATGSGGLFYCFAAD